MYFGNYRLPNMWLSKCLKRHVSKHRTTVKVSKRQQKAARQHLCHNFSLLSGKYSFKISLLLISEIL